MAPEERPASEGGTAPPEPTDRNRAPVGLTREYRTGEIRVQWYADRCIHSAECIRALPAVFDPKRRPWVDVHAAGADELARTIELCPTGALHYVRTDGGAQEPVPAEITVQTIEDGPYYVRGPVRITTSTGELIREELRVALCRCGRSENMPFCDNSHRAHGFRDPGRAPAAGA